MNIVSPFITTQSWLIPRMTSNAAPTGYVASCSATATAAYMGFGSNDAERWALPPASSGVGWLKLQVPYPICVTSWTGQNTAGDTGGLRSFRFEGSLDNANWIVLDTQTNLTWLNMTFKTFNLTTKRMFKYFRINITAGGGLGYPGINRVNFYGLPTTEKQSNAMFYAGGNQL